MLMPTVTLEMEKLTDAGIQICNPPKFLDGQTGTSAMRRNKTVHTSIEVSKFEAVLLKETDNIRISPVSATTWQFDKNGNTEGNGETRNFFESFPKFSKLRPMFFDFIDRNTSPVHIHMGPGGPPSTTTREPKCRISAGKSFAAFVQGVNGTPIVVFVNRNDRYIPSTTEFYPIEENQGWYIPQS